MSEQYDKSDCAPKLSRREFCTALLASCVTTLMPSIVDAKPPKLVKEEGPLLYPNVQLPTEDP